MLNKILAFLAGSIARTPLYPHWLEFRKSNALRVDLIRMLNGKVIEVGAGEGTLKAQSLASNGMITEYISTDYSGWDDAFNAGAQLGNSENLINLLHMRGQRRPIDHVCSALELPYENDSFDWHISTEVLEHIPDPVRYFAEASRVVKKGGGIALIAPFLYRVHPDFDSDFYRILPEGYRQLAQSNGLEIVRISSNTGIGGTIGCLVNQYVIRRYFEAGRTLRIFIVICMPALFILTNLVGLLIDRNPDSRFASRFLIVMRKK